MHALEHGRHQVAQVCERVQAPAGALAPGQSQDERHAQLIVGERHAVPDLHAVVAEGLAVVGSHDDQRVLEPPGLLEQIEDLAHAAVGLEDAGVVVPQELGHLLVLGDALLRLVVQEAEPVQEVVEGPGPGGALAEATGTGVAFW
jgi:hypothetical protein